MILSIIILSIFLSLIAFPILIAVDQSKDCRVEEAARDKNRGTHFMKG